jgi:acidic leucine-rich nuclear phosphoprotein 32 family protein A/C/D
MSKEAIKAIRKELEHGEIEELFLDTIKIDKISEELKQEIEKLEELMCLSMNDCGLVSLSNFPEVKNIIRLELMENKFPARELQHLSHLVSLQSLSLGTNKIERFEDLEPLKKLSELVQLDLSDSSLSQKPDYRAIVFKLFPKLQILDNCDIDGNEYQYNTSNDEEEGEDDNEEESYGDDDEEEGEGSFEDDEEEGEGSFDDDEEEEDDEGEDDEEEEDDDDDDVPRKRIKE